MQAAQIQHLGPRFSVLSVMAMLRQLIDCPGRTESTRLSPSVNPGVERDP
jgi:hypothetical protein